MNSLPGPYAGPNSPTGAWQFVGAAVSSATGFAVPPMTCRTYADHRHAPAPVGPVEIPSALGQGWHGPCAEPFVERLPTGGRTVGDRQDRLHGGGRRAGRTAGGGGFCPGEVPAAGFTDGGGGGRG